MLDPVEFGKAMAAIVRDAIAPLQKRIDGLEARQPERGEKGEPGAPGKDAEPLDAAAIADSVIEMLLGSDRLETLADMQAAKAVAEYFAANPVQHGKDGRDGDRGPQGERGDAGEKGADGAGIADLLIDRDGNLVASMTDGRMKSLGVVVGKDGAPGKDGADFSDCQLDWDGERTLVIRGNGGEIRKSLPVPLDAGYWREGMACEKGDIVTHDGNAWIALRETKAKPCHESKDDWRLFARKGRDGRDGKDGKPPPGPVRLTND